MELATRLPDGRINAPVTFTGTIGGQQAHGEGRADLAPGDPGYDEWDAWLKQG
jgi:hypothetical protein